jgi:hypothetical protein
MTACGGGDTVVIPSDNNPNSSTSVVTTGPITGFGSVIVNGVEFQPRDAAQRVRLPFDNFTGANAKREDALRTGMIVTVKGTFDKSSGKGTYDLIEFQPELRAPLDNFGVDATVIDQTNNRIKLLGGNVVQVEASTIMDSLRDLAELQQIEVQAELQNQRVELEISGNRDNAGVFHATRIAKKAVNFAQGLVQIKGAINATPAPTATGFSIGTAAITVNASTVFKNMQAADLPTSAGVIVEVKGIFNATTGVFTATRVEKKVALGVVQVNDNVRVKGIVAATGLADPNFLLNSPIGSVKVTTNAATVFLKGATVSNFAGVVTAGATLEVEGALQTDGSILATKVAVEVEKIVKIEGNLAAITDIDTTASTVKLNGVTVTVVPQTKLLDAVSGTVFANLAAARAAIGANLPHLQIAGFIDATGKVVASVIQGTAPSNGTFVQGPVTAATSPNLTILGITVVTNAATQFRNFDRTSLTQAAFFTAVSPGTTVVKAKGTVSGSTLTATEVELER